MATSGGAGKDTVADYIVDTLMQGMGIKRALGKPIHELAERYTRNNVERHHLQDLGESMRNIFGEDVWMRDLDRSIEGFHDVVIPDIRKLIEFTHYCVEDSFYPLYIKVDREVAKERLMQRDGGYNEKDLVQPIERQMNFLEAYPAVEVGNNGLTKFGAPYPFNNIYVINNSKDINDTYMQLSDWWEEING